MERFRNLNRQIQTFCDHWAEHIAKDKPLPQTPSTSSYVGSPAAGFPSAEEYAFFTLLSIVITVLYRGIFRPFHPATTSEKNLNIQKLYKQEMKTCQSSDLSQRFAFKMSSSVQLRNSKPLLGVPWSLILLNQRWTTPRERTSFVKPHVPFTIFGSTSSSHC